MASKHIGLGLIKLNTLPLKMLIGTSDIKEEENLRDNSQQIQEKLTDL